MTRAQIEREYRAAKSSFEATHSASARWRCIRLLRKWLLAGGGIRLEKH